MPAPRCRRWTRCFATCGRKVDRSTPPILFWRGENFSLEKLPADHTGRTGCGHELGDEELLVPDPGTTLAEGASDLTANSATSSVVNGCREKQTRCGCPSGVVCTAAMKGTLFWLPRPGLPPPQRPGSQPVMQPPQPYAQPPQPPYGQPQQPYGAPPPAPPYSAPPSPYGAPQPGYPPPSPYGARALSPR